MIEQKQQDIGSSNKIREKKMKNVTAIQKGNEENRRKQHCTSQSDQINQKL